MSTNIERPTPAAAVADRTGSPRRPDVFTTLAALALQCIPGAEQVSVSVRSDDKTLASLAATSPVAAALDRLQDGLREGPCFSTTPEESSLVSHDLEFDTRWLEFGPRAIARGVRSMACHMLLDGSESTYLTVYSSSVGQFTVDDEPAAQLVSLAASALALSDDVDHLRRALQSRTTIGQATGILIERYGLDADGAFEHLVRLSQESNTKLAIVAKSLVMETEVS